MIPWIDSDLELFEKYGGSISYVLNQITEFFESHGYDTIISSPGHTFNAQYFSGLPEIELLSYYIHFVMTYPGFRNAVTCKDCGELIFGPHPETTCHVLSVLNS
jgi:hypothetical protein